MPMSPPPWHKAAPVNAINKALSPVSFTGDGRKSGTAEGQFFCVQCRQSEHEQRSTCFVGAREACEQHALLLSLLPDSSVADSQEPERPKNVPKPYKILKKLHVDIGAYFLY